MSDAYLIFTKEPDVPDPYATRGIVIPKVGMGIQTVKSLSETVSRKARSEVGTTSEKVWFAVVEALEKEGHEVVFYQDLIIETEPLHWHQLPLFS